MITIDAHHILEGNLTLTSPTWLFTNMHIVNIVTQTDSSNYELWLCNDATFDTSGPPTFSGGGNADISVNTDYNSGTNSVYMVYTDNAGSNQIHLTINGTRIMPSALPANDITYIDQDVPRNLLLHDIFLSIKLNDIKPMRNIYINSTPQNEGNLTLSDGVHWNKQYSFINGIKVVTTSTNWDLWLCETNEFSTSLITSRLISASRSGSYDISLLREYNSIDTNVRLIYTDNSKTEKIVNGNFIDGSGWTLENATISGGKLNITATGQYQNHCYRNSGISPLKWYKVTYDITDYTSGNLLINIGGNLWTIMRSAVGTYVEYIRSIAGANAVVYISSGNNAFTGSVDNLSVMEISDASFYITGEGRRSGLNDPSGTSGTITVSGVTMSVAGWSLVSGTYEYNISNSNILSTSVVIIIPNSVDTNTVVNAGIYPNNLSSDGSVKIYSRYVPQADIGVTINITNVW